MPNPTSTLNLSLFAPIFQILLAFYFGNAVSSRFKHFFSVEEGFKKFIGVSPITDEADAFMEMNLNSITDQKKINDIKKKRLEISPQYEKIKDKIIFYFHKGELFNCLRPFYAYAGINCLAMLILSTYLDSWQRLVNLIYINLISIGVFIFLFFRCFYIFYKGKNRKCKHWGPAKSFIVFLFLGIIPVFIPSSLYDYLPQCIGDDWLQKIVNLNQEDLQIILSFFFSFLILGVHIFIIGTLGYDLLSIQSTLKDVYPSSSGIEVRINSGVIKPI